ncbi:MAG TPA: Dyp-type peroxidase [Moraxellaceae bacterium]|nr:Dyp-type peroxidase [Moraxellaceae bacterium]
MPAQTAILAPDASHSRFLVLERRNVSLDALRAAIGRFIATRHWLQTQDEGAALVTAIGFGPGLWQALYDATPAGFRPLEPLDGAFPMPATGGDVFVHINSDRADFCFELAQSLLDDLRDGISVLEEQAGFRYLDNRDLTGFIDGTENPHEPEERAEASLIPFGEFAGGSFAFAQRYVHDMDKWRRLKVDVQEQVIGRTKLDSVELEGDRMPANSHVARNVIEEDGVELEIVRHSMPYGSASGDRGLFFLAYTKDLSIIDRMLANMFGTSGDGLSDRLLHFVTPVGGGYFFVPSESLLQRLAG